MPLPPAPVRHLLAPMLPPLLAPRLKRLGLEADSRTLLIGPHLTHLIPACQALLGPSGHLELLFTAAPPPTLPEGVRLQSGTPSALEGLEASYDLILLFDCFHALEDRPGVVASLAAALAPQATLSLWEGRFLAADWRMRGYAGLFRGRGFAIEDHFSTPLGRGIRFRHA